MLTEQEQETVSGMVDLLDDLMQGATPTEVSKDYHRLRREAMKLTDEV